MPEKKKRYNCDEPDDEIVRDEVSRIFSKHPSDYIEKLEEIGFTYYDDDFDDEEQEEARARPVNSNQLYLVSFFRGDIPLSDRTIEIFLEERRSSKPNSPLIRKYFKQANKHLLALLLHGLQLYPVSEELLADLGFFHEFRNILSVLIEHYTLACEMEQDLECFSELALDFFLRNFFGRIGCVVCTERKISLGNE